MTLEEILREHEAAWNDRPLLRAVYRDWLMLVRDRLATVDGPSVELGSGLGLLRELVQDIVLTDVEPTPWSDEVVDGEELPYEEGTVANLVLFDVFHHLPHPVRFLDEAERVLTLGGRVVLCEPYCSPLSVHVYRRFHHEPLDLEVDPFDERAHSTSEAMDANSALPTLAFFRRREDFERRWPGLELAEARPLASVSYPLTGGFSYRPLAPAILRRPLAVVDRAVAPLARLIALRALIVLERRPRRPDGP